MQDNKKVYIYARKMRNNPTKEERLLLDAFVKQKLSVTSQAVLYGWIADFYFKEAKLTLEVDGKSHDRKEQKVRDEIKAKVLLRHGIETVRIKNESVNQNADGVAAWIARCVEIRIGQLKIYNRKANYRYGVRKRWR